MLDRFRKMIESGDWDSLADLYTADALLDANVPQWRFQHKGPSEIVDQFRTWYREAPPVVLEWSEQQTPSGFVVEMAEQGVEDGRPTYARQVYFFQLKDGLIAEQTLYCTGPWDEDTVKRQAAEAPIYRK